MHARLSSRSFVGREGELAELQLAVREADAARPALVLLGGDSGVGKTRLVAELISRLDLGDVPALVLRGEAVQPTDGELPFAPVLSALRPLSRDGHPALDELPATTRAALATLLPDLAPGDARAAARRDDGAGPLQLFEAVLALLHVLASATTVVLVLEDMHWADRSTRALVAFLARSVRSERVATVLTYRADELHRRHPLRGLLGDLERVDGARRIALAPFDRDELSQALTDILGSAPDPGLLERLLARGEGNPLYTEELLAAGLDGRGAAPQTLSDAFLGRIEQLSPDAQQAVRAVSVGGSLAEPAVAAVTSLPADTVLAGLREAVAAQVLVADGDQALRFRHALLREAVYDDLLPGERSELHHALAVHLEHEIPADDLERCAQVAAHYAAAGDQQAALRTTVVAADAARTACAFGDAAESYDRALELWRRVGDAETVTGIDEPELLLRGAGAHSVIGERQRAEAMLRSALGLIDPGREPGRRAQLLARLARVLWWLNRGPEAVRIDEQALALCPDDEAGRALALSVRAWLARMQVLRGKYSVARDEAQMALAHAVDAGERESEAELRDTLGQALVGLGDVDAGLASLRRAQELARETGSPSLLSTTTHNLADTLGHVGRPREALEIAQAGLREVPREHRRVHDLLALTVADYAHARGDWTLAADTLASAHRLDGTAAMYYGLIEATLATGVGDDERALAALQAIDDLVCDSSEPQYIGRHGELLAELQVRRGDLEAARETIEDAIGRMEVCTDDLFRIVGLSAAGLGIEADRAQRARDLGDAALKRDALARTRVHLSRLAGGEDDVRPVVGAALAQGRAEAARARGRRSASLWARAAATWGELEFPYRAAIARWREAEAALGEGDRDRACAAARAAVDAAHALGAGWLEGEARGLAERARLALDEPTLDAADAREPEPADPFGLTERERQVLALVSQGATNRQIGAALYMAEKTASVHVSRILAKLDVRSRTEAAAVAHRQHLV